MSALRNSPPRPRAKQSSPDYPRCLGVSLAFALVACGGAPSEPRGPYDPSPRTGSDDPVAVQPIAPNDAIVMVMAVAPEDWDGTVVATPATTYPEAHPPPVRPPPPPYPIEPPDPEPAGGMSIPFDDP